LFFFHYPHIQMILNQFLLQSKTMYRKTAKDQLCQSNYFDPQTFHIAVYFYYSYYQSSSNLLLNFLISY